MKQSPFLVGAVRLGATAIRESVLSAAEIRAVTAWASLQTSARWLRLWALDFGLWTRRQRRCEISAAFPSPPARRAAALRLRDETSLRVSLDGCSRPRRR